MCGRFAQPLDTAALQSQLDHLGISCEECAQPAESDHQTRKFNISPTNYSAIYYQQGNKNDDKGLLRYMRWGVIPTWINTWEEVKSNKLSTFNTRLDNIEGKLWKSCHRCIVPIAGYYEWEKKGVPYYITNAKDDQNVILLAGVYTVSTINDTKVYSFSVVTVNADKKMDWLHHRMPLVVDPKSVDDWMEGKDVKYFVDELQWFKVDPRVGNAKLDEVKFIKPLKVNSIDLFFSQKSRTKGEGEGKIKKEEAKEQRQPEVKLKHEYDDEQRGVKRHLDQKKEPQVKKEKKST